MPAARCYSLGFSRRRRRRRDKYHTPFSYIFGSSTLICCNITLVASSLFFFGQIVASSLANRILAPMSIGLLWKAQNQSILLYFDPKKIHPFISVQNKISIRIRIHLYLTKKEFIFTFKILFTDNYATFCFLKKKLYIFSFIFLFILLNVVRFVFLSKVRFVYDYQKVIIM